MVTNSSKPTAHRDQTDESLRLERHCVDDALAGTLSTDEVGADRAVLLARERADAVLSVARERADGASLSAATVAAERLLVDKMRRTERASSDDTLRREREENDRVLTRLLPLERAKTDRYLLTERARADAAVSSRDDFLAMVSHDLRSLLGGVVLCTDVISASASKGVGAEAVQTQMDAAQIQRYAARMNRLIGDLVDVVSIATGKLKLVSTHCDASTVVQEVVQTFAKSATDEGIELSEELPDGPLMADFDGERMLQVLANLVTNAVKFTGRGGSIRVRGQNLGERVLLSVHDTGAGIRPDMLESIFQRFWQAGKDDRRGLGLGLYISRCIVEAHGGRIWAESKLGEGSSIWLELPTTPSSAR